jgi:dienelactone hydrolase
METFETVNFPSGDTFCVADLFLPAPSLKGTPFPAIVVGRGFSNVRDAAVADARRFSSAGYVVLSIDYRTFGGSGGEPRAQLHPLDQVEDFRNAISYLQERDDVDAGRIGIWGTSFGGGIVLYTAAHDSRVKAVVAQVPIIDGGRWARSLKSPSQWKELMTALDEDRRKRYRGERGARIKVFPKHTGETFTAMPADEDEAAYLNSALFLQPTWRDDITLESMEQVIMFRPIDVIHMIGPRALCIIATTGWDPIHPIDPILEAFQKASEPKQLLLHDSWAMGLYQEPEHTLAINQAIAWFGKHLSARRAARA